MRQITVRKPVPQGAALPAHIAEVIESTFSYIVMLRFADGGLSIRWEVDKAIWEAQNADVGDTLYFRFPIEELMLLRD